MHKTPRIFFFFILPVVAALLYPPQALLDNIAVVPVVVIFFVVLGLWMWQGRSLALTFSIFVQGINVIIRLMMFFSNSIDTGGTANGIFMVASLAGLALSVWLMLRLDRQDIHTTMIR